MAISFFSFEQISVTLKVLTDCVFFGQINQYDRVDYWNKGYKLGVFNTEHKWWYWSNCVWQYEV